MLYDVRFVHKISPKEGDVAGPVEIPDAAFSNRNTLAAALRKASIDASYLYPGLRRVLGSGQRVRDFRVEGSKVIVFPVKSVWHAIILTPSF